MEGFCDLPACLVGDECEACPETAVAVFCCEDQLCAGQVPHPWEDMLGAEAHKNFSQSELDDQFNAMGGN